MVHIAVKITLSIPGVPLKGSRKYPGQLGRYACEKIKHIHLENDPSIRKYNQYHDGDDLAGPWCRQVISSHVIDGISRNIPVSSPNVLRKKPQRRCDAAAEIRWLKLDIKY